MANDEKRQEAETRFVTGFESLARVAEALGVGYTTIRKWSKDGEWKEKRAKFQGKVRKKTENAESGRQAKKLSRMLDTMDVMVSGLARIAARLEEGAENGTLTPQKTRMFLDVSESIERLAHAKTLAGEAATWKEKEQIKVLKRQVTLQERKERAERKKEAQSIHISVAPAIEDMIKDG